MQNVFKKQYVMFDMQPKSNDIVYFDNVISYPEHLVKFIEDLDLQPESYSRITPWEDWSASDDSSLIYGKKKNTSPQNLKISSGSEAMDRKTLYIINTLSMAFNMSFDRFLQFKGFDSKDYYLEDWHMMLRKWNPGQSMGPHHDGYEGEEKPIAYTMITYLNDDYEGGELYFKDYDILIKPKAGSMVVFPATFIHEVKEIKDNNRYMMSLSIYKK
jgi:2OG-Fe(II) oxygenase superfamily